jgi:hypothetical protein
LASAWSRSATSGKDRRCADEVLVHVPEAARLLGAHQRVVLGIEVEDDVLLAAEVLELEVLAVGRGHVERWGGVTDLQSHGR